MGVDIFQLCVLLLFIQLSITTQVFSSLPLKCTGEKGLTSIYYPNDEFREPSSAIQTETIFTRNYGKGTPTNVNLTSGDKFSIYYSGIFRPNVTGLHFFRVDSDDGGRLSLDGLRIAGDFGVHNIISSTSQGIPLDAGHPYLITLDYYENTIFAQIHLRISVGNFSGLMPLHNVEVCHLNPKPIENVDCSSLTQGLQGTYYNFAGFKSPVMIRTDSWANFQIDWGTGTPGILLTRPDSFSIKWEGAFTVPESGRYRIGILSLENIRVFVSNMLVIQNGFDVQQKMKMTPILELVAGKFYPLIIYYEETSGTANFELILSRISLPGSIATMPSSLLRVCMNPSIISPLRVSTTGLNYVSFPVVLNTEPIGKVTVRVLAPSSITVTPCTLTFDRSNWNTPQKVRAIATVENQKITFNGNSLQDPFYNNLIAETIIIGTYKNCSSQNNEAMEFATCSSWGDPHYVTFDGVHHDFQGVGNYYLIRSLDSDFVVQTLTSSCGPQVSCNYAVAIKYFNAIFQVFISSQTGIPVVTYNAETSLLGPDFSISQFQDEFNFQLPNQISVRVTSTWWPKGRTYYMNVYVKAPLSFNGTFRGLCGSFDGNKNNDYHNQAGYIVSFESFTSSWIVNSTEDLFQGATVIPKLNNGFSMINGSLVELLPTEILVCSYPVCSFSPDLPPPRNDTPSPPPPPTPTEPCLITQEEAKLYCYKFFVNSTYAKACSALGVNVETFYDSCVFELINMCDYEAIKPSACSFQSACTNSTQPQCECLCNMEGICVSDGQCLCLNGWTGDRCENDPNNSPCALSVFPSSGYVDDYVLVSTAKLIPSNQVKCKFGSIITSDAIIIDDHTVRCKVPPGIGKVEITILDNGLGDNCGANFHYQSFCSNLNDCFRVELASFSYSQFDQVSTICYRVGVKECPICDAASFFLQTDCDQELILPIDLGNLTQITVNDTLGVDVNGIEFRVYFPGDVEEFCFTTTGYTSLINQEYLMLSDEILGNGMIPSPKCKSDFCDSCPCVNGKCFNGLNSYYCQCHKGFYGKRCEYEINECEPNPCLNGGKCIDEIGGYICNCFHTDFNGCNCEILRANITLPPQCNPLPFGNASHFNAFFSDNLISGSSVDGRLAVGGSMTVSPYSVGLGLPEKSCDQMTQGDWIYSLVVGNQIQWISSGKVSNGNLAHNSVTSSISSSVIDGLSQSCVVVQQEVLDFNSEFSYLGSLSQYLVQTLQTGSVVHSNGNLILVASGANDLEVFNIDSSQLFDSFLIFSSQNLFHSASIIINISGNSCGFNGAYDSFKPVKNRLIWNFHECLTFTADQVSIQGTVLAPLAHFSNVKGRLFGQVFAKSWQGSMKIHHQPFSGCLPQI